MERLNEDIRTGQFQKIYLLYGEEEYLKKQYKERLAKAIAAEGDTMNYTSFEGKDTDPREIIDLAETLPFFAERRLIVLENTGFFKNVPLELADYLKELPETTYMVFVEEELDRRGKLYKIVREKGRIVEMNRQDEKTLVKWIRNLAGKEGKQMTEAMARYFLGKAGDNMENIRQELEKLFCYCMCRTDITAADIDAVCTAQTENRIFDMADAVAAGERKKALDYYYGLLALKEPPLRILYLLVRHFRILMEVKDMERLGFTPKDMASRAGVPPFALGKYRAQGRAFSQKKLRSIVEAGVQAEEDVKTGRMGDVLAVETFLIGKCFPLSRGGSS